MKGMKPAEGLGRGRIHLRANSLLRLKQVGSPGMPCRAEIRWRGTFLPHHFQSFSKDFPCRVSKSLEH
jgi:hypothetical protein